MMSPTLLRAFFLAKLPLGAIAGLRVRRLDGEACEVSIPYGWRTTNPFGSIYFAALSMAAELSTGALALMAARGSDEPISVLPVGLTGAFEKKATSLTTFTCTEGASLFSAVNEALATGQGVTTTVNTTGRMEDGTRVSTFTFTWSFKRKTQR